MPSEALAELERDRAGLLEIVADFREFMRCLEIYENREIKPEDRPDTEMMATVQEIEYAELGIELPKRSSPRPRDGAARPRARAASFGPGAAEVES